MEYQRKVELLKVASRHARGTLQDYEYLNVVEDEDLSTEEEVDFVHDRIRNAKVIITMGEEKA